MARARSRGVDVSFLFGEIFLIALCLNYAVRLSRITLDDETLTHEIALLRAEVERRQE